MFACKVMSSFCGEGDAKTSKEIRTIVRDGETRALSDCYSVNMSIYCDQFILFFNIRRKIYEK